MLGVTASELEGLPGQLSPWFDLCHYTLAALAVRKEVGVTRARANPLATWLATMSASFAGSLLANPLLGKFQTCALSLVQILEILGSDWLNLTMLAQRSLQ